MEKATAQNLVKETLESSFDRERFVYLVKNILNHVEEAPFTYRGNLIFNDFVDSIKAAERIGKYNDPEEKLIDILIVHLKKETSLERARTKQRNYVAKYLKGSRGGVLKDAALAAFVAPGGEDWRFSLVKMEYRFNEKGKVEEEFTPARRYSFLVGNNENSHTAQSRLLPLLLEDDKPPTLQALEEAFSVEKVTREFFEKYRDLFLRLRGALHAVVGENSKVRADFESKQVDTVDFAKKLLGQIVFLYFLQKKGWFGVERGKEWGAGSKRFLRKLFEKRRGGYNNFFNDILEPLFYEALRLERPGDYYSRFDCRIPFLNGGLFDPINDYDWVNTDILLSDDIFSNSRKTKEGDTGDGILDIFDRYNFTVKEDEPLEKEVAVDPEMLGKVFENLLAVKDRKSRGTYYTPREIVHYMCQQSLINYLWTELSQQGASAPCPDDAPCSNDAQTASREDKTKRAGVSKADTELSQQGALAPCPDDAPCPDAAHTPARGGETKGAGVSKEDIETLIKYGESVIENDSRVVNKGRETGRYAFKLPQSIRDHARLIDEKLASIRVCDPAVGSGAFPVGMMNEIVRARNALTPYFVSSPAMGEGRGEGGERSPYNFKRHAIQNCLYGVDIDPGAVEICKLRLWLSLLVDEESRETVRPLPNLDYKIVRGNSLLDVEKNLFNNQLFKRLEDLKPLYFNETSASKKKKYKEQIDELISKITNGHKDFDFEVYFSEIFHERTIEKDLRAYLITWVTHNSRVSERMVQYGVKTGEPVMLREQSRTLIADAIAEKTKEKRYRVLAVNVLTDHVHCVVVCEEGDIADIVQELKGYSSYTHNRQLELSASGSGRQTKLWAKGSSQTRLESEEHLLNAIEYVQNNHHKHGVSDTGSSLVNHQLKQMVVGVGKAFAPEVQKGGFDVVIANPPYVRHEQIKEYKPLFKDAYQCYTGVADIYVYFYERGLMLLRKNGTLTFITSNKYMRAGYGGKLRQFLADNSRILELIDFGDAPVFEATSYPSIIILQKDRPQNSRVKALIWERETPIEEFEKTEQSKSFLISQKQLSADGWRIERPAVLRLLEKLRKVGQPLGEYVKGRFYRGILTGLNEAFVVNRTTRDRLVAEHPSSAELLKPFLRGRDVKRWRTGFAEQYLIKIESSENKKHLWSGKPEKEAEKIFARTFPAIHQHFEPFQEKLIQRDDQGKYFWELRSCKYWKAFEEPKIVYPDIAQRAEFTYNQGAYYLVNTLYLIASNEVWLVGLLNSKALFWFYTKISSQIRGNFVRYIAQYVSKIPIAIGSQTKPIENIVDKILAITKDDDYLENLTEQAKVHYYEKQIDQLVYKLYGLTPEEIKIVEGG